MGIKEDWSRVKDTKKYGETIERVFGVRLRLPSKDTPGYDDYLNEVRLILTKYDMKQAAEEIYKMLVNKYQL